LIAWSIPDLDLLDLSLRLVDFDTGPVVFGSFRATISTITQSELVLVTIYFIDGDNIVFVVEHVDSWEVFVLLALDWQVRISESILEFDALTLYNYLSSRGNYFCSLIIIEFCL
jgi:hypothetical protein